MLCFFLWFKMDFTEALFLFMAGAICHAFLSRLLGINVKVRLYRTTLINCLGIMKYASKHAEQFLLATCEKEKERPYVKETIKYWQNLSILSLKNSVPAEIWTSLGVRDWSTASRLIKAVEENRSDNEQI